MTSQSLTVQIGWLAFVALTMGTVACSTPPLDYPKDMSTAFEPSTQTSLGRKVERWRHVNPGPSGFLPLVDGSDALGARLLLADAAERSIDAQYFLMKSDTAGYAFAAALLGAADRGVRVRLLLDDIFTTIKDEELAILDAHANISIRLYNPISRRGIDWLNYIGDFRRANRRMHNKAFIVDNQFAIVGGRNIANEYFKLQDQGEFLDFDVIALGPVSAQLSNTFDIFWNHQRALPLAAVSNKPSQRQLSALRQQIGQTYQNQITAVYRAALDSTLIGQLQDQSIPLHSANAEVITDHPDKLVNKIDPEHMLLAKEVADAVLAAQSEVLILTPYFVPGDQGIEFWRTIVAKGIRVVIVTNSLASNNHTAVHSAYARYRRSLIEAGVILYEVRANAANGAAANTNGNTTLTMHTKAMILDRAKLFVGSLNLDPRSIEINSEMGLLIDAPAMSNALAQRLLASLDDWTYRVTLDDKGALRWHTIIDGFEVTKKSEPLAGWWRKLTAWFLKLVPERQL